MNQDAESHDIVTNMQRFFKHDFNDYKNCHWWPHQDSGYNGIVYFNKDDNTSGTNLYSVKKQYNMTLEHVEPWRPKENFKILKTYLKPSSYGDPLVIAVCDWVRVVDGLLVDNLNLSITWNPVDVLEEPR